MGLTISLHKKKGQLPAREKLGIAPSEGVHISKAKIFKRSIRFPEFMKWEAM